jgi:hypothetical protein|tara:strand:- start:2645 stop:3199 length:555 start_codon:yes stop_codon:yes gene_type:complete
MGLLEKFKRDSDQDREEEVAYELLDKLEATGDKISPKRVVFASFVAVSLLLITIFTLVIAVPYDRVSVDIVYRQGGSGHVILAQLDNHGSREITDISLTIRFTDAEGSELGRTDFLLDSMGAHSFYAGDNLELIINGASVWEEYSIETLLEYNYYNGRGDERWTHDVGNWTMELFTDRAQIKIF